MKIMPENSVSALQLTRLAGLLAWILLLLTRLLAGILALLAWVLVRIVLVTHVDSPSLNIEPTTSISIGFRGT